MFERDRFMSDKEITERIGVTRQTLYRWRRENTFPQSEKLGDMKRGTKKSIFDKWFNDPDAWTGKYKCKVIENE